MTQRPRAATFALTSLTVCSLAAATLYALPAQAAYSKLTLSTAERSLDIPLPVDAQVEPYRGYNQGWWGEHVWHDSDGFDNPNYLTGFADTFGNQRSFFTFHVGRVNRPVVKAVLRLERGRARSTDPSERVALWDVSTDPAGLNRGSAPMESTYRDLGSGVYYGGVSVSTAPEQGDHMRIQLTPAAVAAINRLRGNNRYFSVGASLTTTTGTREEYIWGRTGYPVELLLTLR